MYRKESSSTAVVANELDNEDGIALQDLADDGDCPIDKAALLGIVPREPQQNARASNYWRCGFCSLGRKRTGWTSPAR